MIRKTYADTVISENYNWANDYKIKHVFDEEAKELQTLLCLWLVKPVWLCIFCYHLSTSSSAGVWKEEGREHFSAIELSLNACSFTDTSWPLCFLSSSCFSGFKEHRCQNLLTFPLWSTWTRTVWCVWVGALIITKGTLHSSWWSTQQAGWALASVLMVGWRALISSLGELDQLESTLQ